MSDNTTIVWTNESNSAMLSASETSRALATVSSAAQGLLLRMFANPRLLEKDERTDLVKELRECAALHPENSELRVLLGMSLCVNLEIQDAMEELGEAVSLAPDSYIAHLKMGELWMRLRVCKKAQDHTHQAELLAQNLAQSEMARRQSATIRTMLREGVERGGYTRSSWLSLNRLRRLWTRNRGEALATVDAN